MVENGNPEKVKSILKTTFVILFSFSVFLSSCKKIPDSNLRMNTPRAFSKSPALHGINLGNALDAPSPGEWGVVIKPEYFDVIRAAGFDSVRLPVRFSAHALQTPPYTLDAEFLSQVDEIINKGLSAGLTVILDLHHFDEIMVNPASQSERFLAIWGQLAAHYHDAPSNLYFELLNEPNQNLDPATWNKLAKEAIQIIRTSNPDRKILVGGSSFNSIEALNGLQLPADENLIATFHFYEPIEFTHQGAAWVNGAGQWIGTKWQGTPNEKQAIIEQLDRAASWSEEHQIPLILGEFGSIATADAASRQRWTELVMREAEKRNIGWMYWEFCSEFRVYDCQLDAWDETILNALILK